MPDAPSPVSLSERLKVVRRNLWLVVMIALVAGAVAAVLSLRQTPIYASEAAVSFRDETRDLTLFGGVSQPSDQPAQLAAASAETVTRPQLLRQVKKDLRSPLSVGKLRESVTATADPRSNLVVIESRAGSARGRRLWAMPWPAGRPTAPIRHPGGASGKPPRSSAAASTPCPAVGVATR